MLTWTLVIAGGAVLVIVLAAIWFYRSLKIDAKYEDLYVLITGCDTGFGNICARKLDQMGLHVFAACLSKEKVEELSLSCSQCMVTLQLDVRDETSVLDAFKCVKEHLPEGRGLWAVINNAGVIGPPVICEWLKKSDYQELLDVNFLGMVSVTNTFLPLVRQATGRIVNVASTLGRFATVPASYSLSKFCIEAYSDVLRRELSPFGVSVHTIEPGGYKTNITNIDLHSRSINKKYDGLDKIVKEFYGDKFKDRLIGLITMACFIVGGNTLEDVPNTYIHAITAQYPKTRYVVGLNGNMIFRPLWTLPTWFVDLCIGMVFPQPQGISG